MQVGMGEGLWSNIGMQVAFAVRETTNPLPSESSSLNLIYQSPKHCNRLLGTTYRRCPYGCPILGGFVAYRCVSSHCCRRYKRHWGRTPRWWPCCSTR